MITLPVVPGLYCSIGLRKRSRRRFLKELDELNVVVRNGEIQDMTKSPICVETNEAVPSGRKAINREFQYI